MSELSRQVLSQIAQLSPEGIAVCIRGEKDWPAVFVNSAFQRLTGYSERELLGQDLRMLQGQDRDQESRHRIRAALASGGSCRVLLRNYRRDGTAFWNELLLEPLKDAAGAVTHFIGFHRDASDRLRLEPKPASIAPNRSESFGATSVHLSPLSSLRDDRLTGLYTRDYFNELLRRDWSIAQRENRTLSIMLFDIDCLGLYNDTFGQAAGDACIKRVARAIGACLRRGSDLAARFEGGTVAALVHNMDAEMSARFANTLLDRVREQHIHHPRSIVQRYVTISGGTASIKPTQGDEKWEVLLQKAQAALQEAKNAGRNRVAAA